MSLTDLASIGSFVSGVAVLASLVFLYIQLRQLRAQLAQAEVNQREMINEASATRLSDYLRWTAEPSNSHLMARVIEGERAFNSEEVVRLGLMFRWNIIHLQAVTQHFEAGLIDAAALEGARAGISGLLLSFAVYRAIWALQADTFASPIRKIVEDLMRETPLGPPTTDIAAAFADNLAKVLADASAPESGGPA
jgi:hypothetical protein